MDKIKISGIYTGSSERGTVIGGIPFMPNVEQTSLVDETTFRKLYKAQENGWFKMTDNNYLEFVEFRDRKACKFKVAEKMEKDIKVEKIKKQSVPKIEVVEDPVDTLVSPKEEEKKEPVKKKTTKKAVKKVETTEE